MAEFLAALRGEHEKFGRLLDAVDEQIQQLEAGITVDYELIGEIVDYFLGFPDTTHHPKEDMLYRKLLERAPQEAAAIGDLTREHETLGKRAREFAAAIRAVLADAFVPRDALAGWARGFVDLQRRHIAGEEVIFFRVAELRLRPEDWDELSWRLCEHQASATRDSKRNGFPSQSQNMLGWQTRAGGTVSDSFMRPVYCC